jgi:hypothetical protein
VAAALLQLRTRGIIMSPINLSDKEQQLLIELLEEEIPELRDEIFHTDDHDYRETLKEKEEALKGLLKRLKENTAG